jgi:hypothetical protein
VRSPAILWWSNNPTAPTGYGSQTKTVVSRMAKAGHPVAVASNWGTEGTTSAWPSPYGQNIPIYPRGYDGYSQDVIVGHYEDWAAHHPDIGTTLVTLYDVWVLTNPRLAELPRSIISWVPIDHMPVTNAVASWCARPNVRPIAMSKYGQEQLARKDIESTYIPHTIEDVFHYRKDHGNLMQFPDDTFVVMMNAANKGVHPNRKRWSENLLALSVFMKKHEDVRAYLHTEAQCPAGIDLMMLAQAVGLPSDRLSWPAQYTYRMGGFDENALARLYSQADVLLAASGGEGFGIPVIEAMACGTRTIVSDFSAQPELVSADCYKVDGQPEWNPTQLGFLFTPRVQSIVDALEDAYSKGKVRSQAAVSKAGEYNADRVFKQSWKPLLKEMA